ncbi:hypothetical protein RISK_005816 [Rhodopirellula islandica]|uniref:Uncharacterized protein n=1 Tax=Rhodopirellula islandica TaxID=595434 RepID=A0A0J1B6N7_RHOIS|nr:hypothetical protein RISK_005816 [Rhodopirellula islandica]
MVAQQTEEAPDALGVEITSDNDCDLSFKRIPTDYEPKRTHLDESSAFSPVPSPTHTACLRCHRSMLDGFIGHGRTS